MTRVPSLAVALSAALALGACAGEGGQLATSPEVPAFQTGGVGPACSLTDLRKATTALFGSRHAANEVAKQFTSKNANTAAATPFAFNLFAFIEAKRQGTGWLSGDPEKGAELTIQTIACSDVDYSDNGLEGTANLANARAAFTLALDLAGTGTYAVRGGGTEGDLKSKNSEAALGAPGSQTFSAWLGGRTLVIGYTIPAFSSEADRDVFYDWSMIRPAGSALPVGLARISYCVENASLADGPQLRIQHHATGNNGVILPVTSSHAAGIVCTNTASLRHQVGVSSFAARMVRGLFNVVRPAPLFASAVGFGPVSGTLGDFSPTAVVDPEAVILTFTTEPTNQNAGVALAPFSVKAVGQNSTPWANILVRLTAHTNNATNLAVCNATAVTNNLGVATFTNTYLTKPGNAFLTATTVEPGIDPDVGGGYSDSVDSQPFTVGPGSGTCTP